MSELYYGKSKRAFYETMYTELLSERSSFDSHWQELATWMLPRRARFHTSDRNKGDKRNGNIIDSSARFALRTLQSGLHAGLTSPARPWFKLGTPDPDLSEFGPVREWLHVVTQRMQSVFASTNLYNALPIVYGDLGLFGTAAMAVIADDKDLFRAHPFPVGSYVLGMSNRGIVTTFAREYGLSVRQVVEEFGGEDGQPLKRGRAIDWSRISLNTRNLWDKGQYHTQVDLLWIVLPNPMQHADKLSAKYLPWTSCHFERSSNGGGTPDMLLRESGFHEFPIMAPRWDITGEDTYGTDSPGMTALGDVKQLQSMQRHKGRAIAKLIDPPMQAPTSMMTQKTSLLPGELSYVDAREGQGIRPIHEIGMNLQHLTTDIGETRYLIQRAFYEDLFLMIAQSDRSLGADRPTAREIDERHEEKLLALGPVLERTNDELLDPLIDRVFGMMLRAGLLPEPPEELQGITLRVEYISVMAQAQKFVGVAAQDRFMQTLMPLAEAFPDVRHKVDMFQVVDNYAEMLGIDPRVMVSTDDAKQAAGAEAQAAQMVQEAEMMKTGAQAAQAASQATLPDGSSVLSRATQQQAGAVV